MMVWVCVSVHLRFRSGLRPGVQRVRPSSCSASWSRANLSFLHQKPHVAQKYFLWYPPVRVARARATRTGGYHKKYFCATCGFWCKKDKFARDHEAEQEDGLTRCTPGRKPDRKRKWTETQTQTII